MSGLREGCKDTLDPAAGYIISLALIPINAHMQIYPCEHLGRLGWQILEIDDTDASLSTRTSSTTKRTRSLNPRKSPPLGSR